MKEVKTYDTVANDRSFGELVSRRLKYRHRLEAHWKIKNVEICYGLLPCFILFYIKVS